MRYWKFMLLSGGLILSTAVFAQNAIPAGTVVPVRLNTTFSSHDAPGKRITARIMQNVPLPDGTVIPEGATVSGRVTSVSAGPNARFSFEFDALNVGNRAIPIRTDLRAMASFMDLESAQDPLMGADRGTSESAWTTVQIGGDVIYHGGSVREGHRSVGQPVYDGVLAPVYENGECRGAIEGNDRPQALWLFSSSACGAYGFAHLRIAHAGRTEPLGKIEIASTEGGVKIPSGTGMLLRVIGGGSGTAQTSRN